MSVNFLLKMDGAGIKGESPVKGFTDYIEIDSFTWGATQTGTFAYGSGGGGGKVNMHDFSFEMKTNKASPKLMEACANGSHVKTATLVCRKAGGTAPVEFLKVVMTDVLISSFHTGGHGGNDDIPMDRISLNFSKVVFSYKDQKADGTGGTNVDGGWDSRAMVSGK